MAGLYDVWINPDTEAENHTFTIITVPGNPLIQEITAARMPVILPWGREKDWLRSSNHLSVMLGVLEMYLADKKNAYPLSQDLNQDVPFTRDILKPIGDLIYNEVEPRVLPHRHWGHKQIGASGTWRAAEGA